MADNWENYVSGPFCQHWREFGDGCQAFCLERHEQINEHGYNDCVDEWHTHNELIKGALFCINPNQFEFPFNWSNKAREKILSKNNLDRLRVAGAFLAAEYDRIKLSIKNN